MERLPNQQQNAVINDLDNNIILFASAGTGKTFTVANRVAQILASGRATPQEILCLTFTIKASKEMSEDILGYAGKEAKEVLVNTIHGFCYRLLLEENKHFLNRYNDLSVCDEVDEEEILRSILSSRYYYWQLEERLAVQGLPLPNLEECEICQLKNNDTLFFKIGEKLVDLEGEIYDITDTMQFVEAEVYCPICKEIYPINGRVCANCANSLDIRLHSRTFDIFNQKQKLRTLVAELKHYREKHGFFTEDAVADYQRTLQFLKEKDERKYKNLISYSAKYVGYTSDDDYAYAIERFVGRLITEYDAYLQASNLVDFDDLILKTNDYLQDAEIIARWASRFKYIIVDEMQDTSSLEYKVLKRLFANNNVMLCGDFFQTIYEWRGSNPEVILNEYIQEFSAKIYMFSENYRATKTLAAASFGYLKNTYPQWMGKYCPEDLTINSTTDGDKILCYAYDNPEEEAWKIYKYLQATKEQALKTCILTRNNSYIAKLYNAFEKFNRDEDEENQLRFFSVEENFNLYKKPVVKDILAVLRLLFNRLDRMSFERLTEKYVKAVGIKTIEALRGYNHLGISILSFLDTQTHLFGDCYHHLLEGYQAENIVVYDTETTGLDLSKDEIVQISAIKLGRFGEIIDTLDLLVEPTVEISQEAYETHGFDLEYIRQNGGVSTVEALEKFSAFVKGGVLVGHNNLSFDKPLVTRQLKENNLPVLENIAEYDTLVIAKQFYPYLSNFKLATLCERFNVINECAHNALGDITATGKCLLAMIEESVLPTTMERVAILTKHREKFAKIFTFIEEVQARLERGEELVEYIIDNLLLKKRYATNADYAAMRDIADILKITGEDRETFLKEFLNNTALSGSQIDVLIQKLKQIPIITVHQSKGCEFDTVILAGADDNNFPSYAARQNGTEEEEKKVFYVAITRAKKKLILTRVTKNFKYEVHETPYFWMIPDEYLQTNHAWRTGE